MKEVLKKFILFDQQALDEEAFTKWFKDNRAEWDERKKIFEGESKEFLENLSKMTSFEAEVKFNKIYSNLFNIPEIDYVIVANYVNKNNEYDKDMLFSTIIRPNVENNKNLSISKEIIRDLIKEKEAEEVQEKIRNHYNSFLERIKKNIDDKQEAKDLFIQLYYEHKRMYRTLKKNNQKIYNSNYYDLFYSRQKSSGKQIEAYMLHLAEKHYLKNSSIKIESGNFYQILDNLEKTFEEEETGYYHLQSIIIRSFNSRAGSVSGDIVLLDAKNNILLNFQLKSVARARTVVFSEKLEKTLNKLKDSLSDPSQIFKLYSDSYSQQLTSDRAKEVEKEVINKWEEKFNNRIENSQTFKQLVANVVG